MMVSRVACYISFCCLLVLPVAASVQEPFDSALPSSLQSDGDEEEFSQEWLKADRIILEGLDKVTARVFTAEVFVEQLVRFGTLELYVRAAYKRPPEDPPETACFLEIYDCKQGADRECVFSGWMFASDPSLSALEHPVYDVWVKGAKVLPLVEHTS